MGLLFDALEPRCEDGQNKSKAYLFETASVGPHRFAEMAQTFDRLLKSQAHTLI
jgi:hypothetical protein